MIWSIFLAFPVGVLVGGLVWSFCIGRRIRSAARHIQPIDLERVFRDRSATNSELWDCQWFNSLLKTKKFAEPEQPVEQDTMNFTGSTEGMNPDPAPNRHD